MIWHDRHNVIIDQHLGDRRILVAGIHDHDFRIVFFKLFIYIWECGAVMKVPGMDRIPKYPAPFVTCCLYAISEDFLVLSFMEPTALRIDRTLLLLLHRYLRC